MEEQPYPGNSLSQCLYSLELRPIVCWADKMGTLAPSSLLFISILDIVIVIEQFLSSHCLVVAFLLVT